MLTETTFQKELVPHGVKTYFSYTHKIGFRYLSSIRPLIPLNHFDIHVGEPSRKREVNVGSILFL